MTLKIEDFSSFLSIFYLGLSIGAILIYEWTRKDSFDPFSGIVLLSLYFLFELVFVPLVRVMAMSDPYEWGSWYSRSGWLDNDFMIHATSFNVIAYWLFVSGYYVTVSKWSFQRIDRTDYYLRQRSYLWISAVVAVSSCLLTFVQIYWLTALGEGVNIDAILRRAIFERAAVYNFDPELSFIVSLMQIVSGIMIVVILAAFVPLVLNSKNRLCQFIWLIAFFVVILYGALSGYRMAVIWPLITPFILLFYFGNFPRRKLKKITIRTAVAAIFLIIVASHIQTNISTSVAQYGEISWRSLSSGSKTENITEFLNNTTTLVSRSTFAAVLGIINYYNRSDNRLSGETFTDMVLSVIPRRIWTNKKMVYGADEITLHMGLPLTTHTTIGIHGELFANFGYMGVIIMLVYGSVFGLLETYKKKNEITLLVFATYIGSARMLVHFDFGFTGLFISVYTSLCYWMVLRVVFYRRVRTRSDTITVAVP